MTKVTLEAWLVGLQTAQVAFLLLHDWIPLGRWSNLAAVQAIDSRGRLLWTTLLSALPFALGLGFSIGCFPRWPMWLLIWLQWMYALSLVAVVFAWWIPYLSPSDSPRAERYRSRFAGTLSFLPKRHGFAPDALHTIYHATVLATALLLFLL